MQYYLVSELYSAIQHGMSQFEDLRSDVNTEGLSRGYNAMGKGVTYHNLEVMT